MQVYKSILYRLRAGESARQIARDKWAGRRKVNEIKRVATSQGWLNANSELPDEATLAAVVEHLSALQSSPDKPSNSLAEAFKEFITTAVNEGITAQVIHQRLIEFHQFKGAYNSVQRFVQKIKRASLSNMTVPLNFEIAEAAQVDFGQGPVLYDERVGKCVKTWFFVMTLCWSRHQYVELVTHQDVETWLRCHQNAFIFFDGVVDKIIIDNAKCAITKVNYYNPIVQKDYEAFAQDYGFIISACPPYDPQKKGRVESGVNYVKRNFLPLRTFKNLQQANVDLKKWNIEVAGIRVHGSTFKKPLELFYDVEKDKLSPLPTSLPDIATWHAVSLYRDCHVRFRYCRYSVPYELYQKTLWLEATPTMISIYHEHQCVATHARAFEKGSIRTRMEHLPPNAQFYLKRNALWCLEKAASVGEHCLLMIDDMLNHRSKDLLRQAQGILSLLKNHEKARLEMACQRAIGFDVYDYQTIKLMLKEGLENEPLPAAQPEELSRNIYQGHANFQRQPQEFIN
jgi:transposase